MMAAAERGEPSAMFIFDESLHTLATRSRGVGFPLQAHMDSELVKVRSVDPAELSPGEFIAAIRRSVEVDGARVVVIDSLNGYLNAMPEEKFVLVQLHELLAYLGQLGVVTILVSAQQGLIGQMHNVIDASYLADTVVLLRYFEHEGAVRQAVSVLKKRTGAHERTIREMDIGAGGVRIGEPLRQFRGVLTGVPYEKAAPGKPGSSRTSASESNTTRCGFSRSTSSRMRRVVEPSSTSEGWNIVYWLSASSWSPPGVISWMWMPSSDQPCEAATACSSSSVSDSVMYSTVSPWRRPSIRNCNAMVVLPAPGTPSSR